MNEIMSATRRFIYNLLILLIFLSVSCTPRKKGSGRYGECTVNADCPGGKVCISNLCDPPPAPVKQRVAPPAPRGMVYVPAGPFVAGSPKGRGTDLERPQGSFTVRDFFMDAREVTVGQYLECVASGSCPEIRGLETRPAGEPISGVTAAQAEAYCRYRGGRLPTELEWEKSCRGTDGRLYPWGDGAPSCSNALMADCPVTYDPSVCRGPSPYGACDMAGSLWEWTSTRLPPWDRAQDPRRERMHLGAQPDDSSRALAVIRGGSLADGPGALRCATRLLVPPQLVSPNVGFRCVRDVKSEPKPVKH